MRDLISDIGLLVEEEDLSITDARMLHNENNAILIDFPYFYKLLTTLPEESLENIKEVFYNNLLILNTKLATINGNLTTRIHRYFDSKFEQYYIGEHNVHAKVPVYDNQSLQKILEDKEGIKFMQSILLTNDEPGDIFGNFKKLSKDDSILISTPHKCDRNRFKDYIMGLLCNENGVLIRSYKSYNVKGRSLGITKDMI